MRELPQRSLDTWECLSRLKKLETFIVIHESLDHCTLEHVWSDERALNVVLIDCKFEDRDEGPIVDKWTESKVKRNIRIRDVWLRATQEGYHSFQIPIEWAKSRLLKGEECITS